MSIELSNGVIIPEEYSDDWYDEMSINLRKLNDVITAASDNATDIQRLDTDKANQSDLTALTSRVSQNETDIIALQTAVSGALKREIVQTLPTQDISTTTIYMIRNSQSSGTNIYDEYMYINSQWELIGTSATDFSNYYTKNETDNLLSGKVDNSTLGSYYTKTESDNLLSAKANQTDLTALSGRVTQTETDITALQTAVSGALKREIVQSLPTQDISTTTIYMIRNTTTSGDNIYDEYMYINNLWELIGTSATDFSNYYTKTEIDTLLSGKADDNSVVHKSSNETVGGQKTFSDTATFSSVNIDDIRWKSLSNQTIDLNDCYIPKAGAISGYYTIDISSGANISNKAVNTAFTMLSLTTRRNSASDYQVRQVFYGSGVKYIRTCSNGTWTAWINEADKYVTTDTNQTIDGEKLFTNINAISSNAEIGSTAGNNSFKVLDKNKKIISLLEGGTFSTGMAYSYLLVNNGSDVFNGVSLYQSSTNLAQLRPYSSTLSLQLGASNRPFSDCYTSKINSLNPGALSMPSASLSSIVDISGYITVLDGSSANTYKAPVDGYIAITLSNSSGIQAYINGFWGNQMVRPTAGAVRFFMPICKNMKAYILIFGGTVDNARFFPCQGNI